jgi:hypothetical protein
MEEQEWIKLRGEIEAANSISSIKKIAAWFAVDSPVPPPSAYKQELIKTYAKAYGVDTLVETGTYLGDMVQTTKAYFKEVHSIELGQELYQNAKDRFRSDKNVRLYQGDSGELLMGILKKLKRPAIFWLDAHYSEGITAKGKTNTPVVEEVEAILAHKVSGHVILIDDSRIFNGKDGYPTISYLEKKIHKALPKASFIDRHDIIRIQPDNKYLEI